MSSSFDIDVVNERGCAQMLWTGFWMTNNHNVQVNVCVLHHLSGRVRPSSMASFGRKGHRRKCVKRGGQNGQRKNEVTAWKYEPKKMAATRGALKELHWLAGGALRREIPQLRAGSNIVALGRGDEAFLLPLLLPLKACSHWQNLSTGQRRLKGERAFYYEFWLYWEPPGRGRERGNIDWIAIDTYIDWLDLLTLDDLVLDRKYCRRSGFFWLTRCQHKKRATKLGSDLVEKGDWYSVRHGRKMGKNAPYSASFGGLFWVG